jgi:hypothetical protein
LFFPEPCYQGCNSGKIGCERCSCNPEILINRKAGKNIALGKAFSVQRAVNIIIVYQTALFPSRNPEPR